MKSADVIVIGGGVIGLSTAYELKKDGADVLCLEGQESFGQAQSVGVSRIFRHWHDHPDLIELAQLSRARWSEWESDLGQNLVLNTGQIVRADSRWIEAMTTGLSRVGVSAEVISSERAAELMSLLTIRSIGGKRAKHLWLPESGAIKARETLKALSNAIGDRLLTSRTVTEIHATSGGFTLTSPSSPERDFQCEQLLIAAGAQTRALAAQLGINVPVSESWHARLTFLIKPDAHRPEAAQPCFSDHSGKHGETAYGLPIGRTHYAVGLTSERPISDPSDLTQQERSFKKIRRYVSRALPGLESKERQSVLCLASQLDQRGADDLDLYSDSTGMALAVAGGNLFKFAPVLGHQLAVDLRS